VDDDPVREDLSECRYPRTNSSFTLVESREIERHRKPAMIVALGHYFLWGYRIAVNKSSSDSLGQEGLAA
jgi:hypothetical protein